MRSPVARSFLLLSCIASSALLAQDGTFEILKGGDVVGSIAVGRIVQGDGVSYSMISLSNFTILWNQEVRTVTSTHYVGGQVTDCMSTVHLNKAMRDSSRLRNVAGRGLYFVHPRVVYADALPTNGWTTARMYYEEPIGQDSIFVESALVDCPMEHIGEGEYRMTLPNKTRNHYIYRNGLLLEIRVERSWFDLVFRRIG